MKQRCVRSVWCLAVLTAMVIVRCGVSEHPSQTTARPNILIIFTDDQGYGDLGCFGSTTIRTPRFDLLAEEGTRFTSFYVQPVCGPSRSSLLTGRYPVRSHGWSMPASEITFAELIKQAGYATACIGKWDVSNRAYIPGRVPNDQGFDYYWGPLGANDNGTVDLYDNRTHIGIDKDLGTLSRRYTDKAIQFITEHRDGPFLVYLAHTMVHAIVAASPDFRGKSQGGLYGDAMEELDYNTGRLLDALDNLGLRDNTLVLYTSDNGPWCNMKEKLRERHHGEIGWGSAGPLRDGKGSTWEGGVRVPCIVRWPGHVPAGRVSDALFSTVDFLPTFAGLAGYQVPQDRFLDGVDQTALLFGESETGARGVQYYLCQNQFHGVRKGDWKLLLPNRKQYYGYVQDRGTPGIELYNLATDIGETHNVADQHPDIVKDLQAVADGFNMPESAKDYKIMIRLE